MSRHYVRTPCRACGQNTWTTSAPELAQCGHCRSALSAPELAQSAHNVASVAQQRVLRHLEQVRPVAAACPICFENTGPKMKYAWEVQNESWDNSDCCNAHELCRPCVQRYVEMKVLEDGQWNIRCPGEGCRYHLIDDDINKALQDSVQRRQVLDKRAQLRNENFAPRLEELLAARKAMSTDCSEALLLAECQVCPSCSVLVRREGGCTHIVCRCGQDFCFGCGAPFSEDGDDDHCVCDEREDDGVHVTEDDLEGEGRPLLGFWRQRQQWLQDHSLGGEVLPVQNFTTVLEPVGSSEAAGLAVGSLVRLLDSGLEGRITHSNGHAHKVDGAWWHESEMQSCEEPPSLPEANVSDRCTQKSCLSEDENCLSEEEDCLSEFETCLREEETVALGPAVGKPPQLCRAKSLPSCAELSRVERTFDL